MPNEPFFANMILSTLCLHLQVLLKDGSRS